MLKILYAAANNVNARIQLSRFIKAIEGKPYIVKVAAYKKSSPDINVDWTLDCLLNIFKPDQISLDNDNFQTYFEQVKYFAPDLIISDLEYFTSFIANELDITLWQCSSSLINHAVIDKYDLGLFKRYSFLMKKNNALATQRLANIIDNSNYNLVYSHLGDTENPPQLKEKFEWIRPYHTVGKRSPVCCHNIAAGSLRNNRNILNLMKQYPDCVSFTEFPYEKHADVQMKDIRNQEEYFCNLKNSNLFICEGQTSFLADAYYNEKYSVVWTDFKDLECITNSIFSEKFNLSTSVYDLKADLSQFTDRSVKSRYNDRIQLLHEKLEEI